MTIKFGDFVELLPAWQDEGDVLPLLAINLEANDLDDAMVTLVAAAVTDAGMPALARLRALTYLGLPSATISELTRPKSSLPSKTRWNTTRIESSATYCQTSLCHTR